LGRVKKKNWDYMDTEKCEKKMIDSNNVVKRAEKKK